ncbi:hypothetical protein R9C00_06580 [Flammeovirgaceae bacterium SG7u.111]|nr:hypothetical protein [Flammeovirgaceae bacterium SG7u.132]WPO37107.1 hypothetical protein R9C00_06580 [Flammeovirgaceae bacterium SG7u.111]
MAFFPLAAVCQSPESHQKTPFTDSLNNLYINQALPINILALIAGEDSSRYTLQNQQAEKEGIRFQKSGKYYLDLYPAALGKNATEGRFFIGVDGEAPITTHVFTGAPSFKTDTLTFFGKGLKLALSSTDNLAGLKGIFYRIDWQSYFEYSDSILLSSHGEHQVLFYAADRVGNVEQLKDIHFFVDTLPPSTFYSPEGIHLENTFSPNAKISLNATDDGAGIKSIQYAFNENASKTYTNLLSLTSFPDGQHQLHYSSTDKVKNREIQKTYDFYLDKIPPYVVYKVVGKKFLGNQLYAAPGAKIKLNAVDNHAGVDSIFYSIDGGKASTYTEMFELAQLSGAHQISYYATDKVGNTSKANSEKLGIFFDDQPPVLSPRFAGKTFNSRDTLFIKENTELILNVEDKASGVKKSSFLLDKGVQTSYESPIKVKEEGFHQIVFLATDQVGNQSSDTISFFVDNTPPELIFNFSTAAIQKEIDGEIHYAIPPHGIIYLSAVDAKTGVDEIYYKVGNGNERKYIEALSNFKIGQKIAITITVTDVLGNATSDILNVIIEQ